MSLRSRIARTCATPGCTRSTDWPRDPQLVAALCRECTDALLVPRDNRPAWRRWTLEHQNAKALS